MKALLLALVVSSPFMEWGADVAAMGVLSPVTTS